VGIVFELPARTAAEMRAPQTAVERPETDTRQCFAPWDEPVVDKDGRVFPCCFAMTHAQSMLGDLKTERFAAIWHGAKFADFRRGIVDGRTTPDICRMCTVAPTGPHLFRELSVELVPGESRLSGTEGLRLVVRNTGTATWTRSDEIHIGTASPRDAVSALHHQTWIGGNRIATFLEESVPPGSTATFAFEVTPGDAAVTETFQLVAEHRAWLPGTRFQVSVPRQPMSRLRAALRALGASR
jgi:radical SAM protein with 4Fe4S-binding SPASM domain